MARSAPLASLGLCALLAGMPQASVAAGSEGAERQDAAVGTEPQDAAVGTQRRAPDAAPLRSPRFFDPEDGALDVGPFLEEPRGFLPVPLVVTEPALDYGGGVLGLFLRPRREAGGEGWSRPDASAVGAIATRNGTRAAFAGDASHWLGGRLRTVAGLGTGDVNLDFYGLGGDASSLDRAVRYTLRFTGGLAQANWKLADGAPWAVGLRWVVADVTPVLDGDPIFPGLADRTKVTVSAPVAVLEYDARDNLFTPTRGVYAETSYLASRQSLGASVDFERFRQLAMGWIPVGRDLTLGLRGDFAASSERTPFFLRPYVILRGVPAMRWQGDRAMSAEVEGRWRLQGRWSVLAFGGAGRTENRRFDDASRTVGAFGTGIRYELARRFGLHVGADVAHSPGTTALYLQIGSAWFHP